MIRWRLVSWAGVCTVQRIRPGLASPPPPPPTAPAPRPPAPRPPAPIPPPNNLTQAGRRTKRPPRTARERSFGWAPPPQVFGAFWMLVGVATLGALISTFIQTMMEEKKAEQRRRKDVKREFQEFMTRACGDAETMDKTQFLKFGLLLTKGVDPAALRSIELRFDHLLKQSGAGKTLRRTTLVDIEGPL